MALSRKGISDNDKNQIWHLLYIMRQEILAAGTFTLSEFLGVVLAIERLHMRACKQAFAGIFQNVPACFP
jgi:hypothetical protein